MSELDTYLTTRSDRCPHGFHVATQGCSDCGIALKFKGQSLAAAAHPAELAKVETAIRQAAATGRPFSANEIRPLHGVRGGVVGKAFTNMRIAGVIEPCGDETSTSGPTHGHRIFQWKASAA